MTGVTTGGRLAQLRALARRIAHEIAIEERDQALAPRGVSAGLVASPALPRRVAPPVQLHVVRVPVNQVRPDVIRDWATTQGHELGHRGRVPRDVLAGYVEAHR